jgi:hypothetical protein
MRLYNGKADLEEWGERSVLNLHVTVDKGGRTGAGRTGMVPAAVEGLELDRRIPLPLCAGPSGHEKFTIPVLTGMGLTPDRILLFPLREDEVRHRKCGMVQHRRQVTVHTDGPVFISPSWTGFRRSTEHDRPKRRPMPACGA